MQMKIFELKTLLTKTPAANSTYPKVAVQWLNQAWCFYSSSVLVDSFVLRLLSSDWGVPLNPHIIIPSKLPTFFTYSL